MRRQLRTLADHHAVEVGDDHAVFGDHRRHMTQHQAAVGTLPARIGGRKVLANIAQCQRAQQRIAERVQQHVAIGMREQTMIMGHAHTAEHHMVAGPEGVNVIADADAHVSSRAVPTTA